MRSGEQDDGSCLPSADIARGETALVCRSGVNGRRNSRVGRDGEITISSYLGRRSPTGDEEYRPVSRVNGPLAGHIPSLDISSMSILLSVVMGVLSR